MHVATRLSAAIILAFCAACSPPAAPPDERPPEPQASARPDAIHTPADQAKAAV